MATLVLSSTALDFFRLASPRLSSSNNNSSSTHHGVDLLLLAVFVREARSGEREGFLGRTVERHRVPATWFLFRSVDSIAMLSSSFLAEKIVQLKLRRVHFWLGGIVQYYCTVVQYLYVRIQYGEQVTGTVVVLLVLGFKRRPGFLTRALTSRSENNMRLSLGLVACLPGSVSRVIAELEPRLHRHHTRCH